MTLNPHHLHTVTEQIKQISQQVLLQNTNAIERHSKTDGSYLTAADLNMQQQITHLLKQYFADIPLLGEEMDAGEQMAILRQGKAFWCLDPIDGTSNYSTGLPYFAVSLALIENGHTVWALVYDPSRDECFQAEKGKGARLNGQLLKLDNTIEKLQQALALVDFKKMDTALARTLISEQPWSSQRSLGSIALDWCWLACNRVQTYLHCRHSLWDFAAALLVFEEAGGHYSTLEGKELDFYTLEKQIAIAAVNKTLFEQWQHYLHNINNR